MFLKYLGTKKNHGRSKALFLMATSTPWLTDGEQYGYLHRLRNTINCSRPRGPRVKAPPLLTYPSLPQPSDKALSHVCC